jgi:cold shock protein
MPTGTVKWFNNAKGYGFILSEESGDDIFAHYSAIEMEGYKTLKAGQVVNFELINGDKGVHAAHINAENPAPQEQASNSELSQPVMAAENFNY